MQPKGRRRRFILILRRYFYLDVLGIAALSAIYGLLNFANNRAFKNGIRLQPYIRPVNELVALAMMVIRVHCANQPSGFAIH